MGNREKILPAVLALSIAGEAILAERPHDVMVQPHNHVEVTVPATIDVSSPSITGGGARSATLTYRINTD